MFSRWRATGQRDFWLGVLNGLFFTLAETLTDPTLVLATFVGRLTPSPVLIGLVAPLRDGGWYLPQLWVSGYMQSQPRKLRVYRITSVVRMIAWAGLALSAFTLQAPDALVVAFFATFGAYALASGFGGLAFVEVVGKTIPPHRRAVFFAWRLFTGGVVALGAAAIVRWVLDENGPLPFPHNFGALFAFGWLWAALGLFAFQMLNEPPDEQLLPRASLTAQFRRAWLAVRRDPSYQRFLVMRASLVLAGAALPFFAVYVQRQLGGSLDMVGVYLAVYTVASLATNVLFGRFAMRLGNRRILEWAALAGMVMTALVLALLVAAQVWDVSGAVASAWLVPVFIFAGIRESGLGVASQPLMLEIAPVGERSLYVGFTNTWLGIVQLSTGASGLVVATFGFGALVLLTFVVYGLALVLAIQLRVQTPPDIGAASKTLFQG